MLSHCLNLQNKEGVLYQVLINLHLSMFYKQNVEFFYRIDGFCKFIYTTNQTLISRLTQIRWSCISDTSKDWYFIWQLQRNILVIYLIYTERLIKKTNKFQTMSSNKYFLSNYNIPSVSRLGKGPVGMLTPLDIWLFILFKSMRLRVEESKLHTSILTFPIIFSIYLLRKKLIMGHKL